MKLIKFFKSFLQFLSVSKYEICKNVFTYRVVQKKYYQKSRFFCFQEYFFNHHPVLIK